jgi:LysR family transcriptional regulator, transcriptional activator of nhaA
MVSNLNFHHLRYFWTAGREGGISRAAEKLRVSQPSLSAQIHQLEGMLGQKLFARSGRTLVLTEAGRLMFGYAEQIFGLGQEMLDALHDRPAAQPMRMSVGLANSVPKRVAHRLLEPLFRLAPSVRLECVENQPEALLADLAGHRLDAVLSDAPAPPTVRVQAFSHLLGESPVSILGTAKLVRGLRGTFPKSLDGAPVLLPTSNTALRRALDSWLEQHGIRPRVIAEAEDSALLEAFGHGGLGLFPAPQAIESDLRRRLGLRVAGRVTAVRERVYVLTVERRIQHPGVVALAEQARKALATRRG